MVISPDGMGKLPTKLDLTEKEALAVDWEGPGGPGVSACGTKCAGTIAA
jgi:hypothetical protein